MNTPLTLSTEVILEVKHHVTGW